MGASNSQETDIATGQCRDEALYSITGPFAFREKDTDLLRAHLNLYQTIVYSSHTSIKRLTSVS